MEYVANGRSARVYRLSGDEPQARIQRAQLVRKEGHENPLNYAILYCIHDICHTAFPEHFAEVVSCGVDMRSSSVNLDEGGIPSYRPNHRLYFKELDVPKEHHHFGSQASIGLHGEKLSTCGCFDCTKHRLIHDENRKRMCELSQELKGYGIITPWDDLSDWCVDSTGSIVFFEADLFLTAVFRNRFNEFDFEPKVGGRVLKQLAFVENSGYIDRF